MSTTTTTKRECDGPSCRKSAKGGHTAIVFPIDAPLPPGVTLAHVVEHGSSGDGFLVGDFCSRRCENAARAKVGAAAKD